jgi:hypothetical protein
MRRVLAVAVVAWLASIAAASVAALAAGCSATAAHGVSLGTLDGGHDADADAPPDAADAGCMPTPYCAAGQLTSFCCPDGYKCLSQTYCDLGGGACANAPCPDAAPPCELPPPEAGADGLWYRDYDVSCQSDADCVPVYLGYSCGCTCSNATINQVSLPAYNADALEAGTLGTLCDCPHLPPPRCVSGICLLCVEGIIEGFVGECIGP